MILISHFLGLFLQNIRDYGFQEVVLHHSDENLNYNDPFPKNLKGISERQKTTNKCAFDPVKALVQFS